MAWYAVSAIEDAVAATRGFLFPFELRRWLRLAVIVFFIGWGTSGPSASGNASNVVGNGPLDAAPSFPEARLVLLLVLALLAVLLVVGLVFAAIGSVMRFVLIEALRTGEVAVRRPFRRWFWPGLRLFGFVIGLSLLVLGPVALLLVVTAFLGLLPAALLVAIPLLVVVALSVGLVVMLTVEFVVPTMMVEEDTVLGGWRRFWPTLVDEWRQFAVYVVLRWVLGLVVGLVTSIVLGILVLPVVVVAALVVGAGTLLGIAVPLALLAVVAVLALPVLLVLFVIGLFLGVIVRTFFGYYALLVLGDVDPDLDLIPGLRESIRAEEESAAGTEGDAG